MSSFTSETSDDCGLPVVWCRPKRADNVQQVTPQAPLANAELITANVPSTFKVLRLLRIFDDSIS